MADNPIFELDPPVVKGQFTRLFEVSYSKDKFTTKEMVASINAGELCFEVDWEGHASMSGGGKRVNFKIDKDEASASFLLGGANAGLGALRIYAQPLRNGRVRITSVASFGKDGVLKFSAEQAIVVDVDALIDKLASGCSGLYCEAYRKLKGRGETIEQQINSAVN
ncbi:MAG: hypothetical protein LBG61_00690 [Burkholderiales bacterium]|jgi:hypothetical protein|nr:hypothetical protein [Burkholderiales bacterium]